MKSLWSEDEALEVVRRYGDEGVSEDLALRVYTTRLLGGDARLVLHGGGNTSVKSRARDVTGDELEVLYVKGSGWDMATIEPAGLPAVQLAPLLRLARLGELSDEEMVNLQRRNLLDSTAPNPSVETLLHAWISHKFIDHTHANAVVTLTDQADGEAISREVFGERVAIVPYIMPGFELAKEAKAAVDRQPDALGMILLKHGIFTFGRDAREAYQRMIEWVSQAEARIARARPVTVNADLAPRMGPAGLAPTLRGALANPREDGRGGFERFILDFRTGPGILSYMEGEGFRRYARSGTVTPDHVIRTKPWPVVLPEPTGDLDRWRTEARAAVEDYRREYERYFERHNPRHEGSKVRLDTAPRVAFVPGVGLFAAGKDAAGAAAAADLAEATVEVITAAEEVGRFESISEAELFDIEYWSLEQAKLARGEKPLSRHVVVITGGAGAIGRATARAFRDAGAEVAILDLPGSQLAGAAEQAGARGVECDVTVDASVRRAIEEVIVALGGIDILVSNAGAAWSGGMVEVEDDVLRKSFELNFFGHQRMARACAAVMLEQGTGGCLLFNVSKQAVNPGPDFGPYGLPKAATLALVRQYAVEHGRRGIRSNGVNADRIRSGLLTNEMIQARSEARGVSEQTYMEGNLLGVEVEADDVADAFVALARARATTGAILTVDGGNIAAALR